MFGFSQRTENTACQSSIGGILTAGHKTFKGPVFTMPLALQGDNTGNRQRSRRCSVTHARVRKAQTGAFLTACWRSRSPKRPAHSRGNAHAPSFCSYIQNWKGWWAGSRCQRWGPCQEPLKRSGFRASLLRRVPGAAPGRGGSGGRRGGRAGPLGGPGGKRAPQRP